MYRWKNSTQNNKWIFSKSELDHLQLTKFERGLKILAELNKEQPVTANPNDNSKQQKVLVNLKSKIINIRNYSAIRRKRIYNFFYKFFEGLNQWNENLQEFKNLCSYIFQKILFKENIHRLRSRLFVKCLYFFRM